MREIKFRAWDTIKRRFTKPENLLNPNIMSIKLTENGFRFPNTTESTFIYEQYTGLKDKNGKEIYEGDIFIDINGNKYIVKYDNEKSYCYGQDIHNQLIIMFPIDSNNIEIISNIHDNPELRT